MISNTVEKICSHLNMTFFICLTYLQKGHRCKQAWKEVNATHSLYRGHFVRDKQFFLPVGSESVAHQIPDKAKKFYAKLPILVLVLASWLGCLQRLPGRSVQIMIMLHRLSILWMWWDLPNKKYKSWECRHLTITNFWTYSFLRSKEEQKHSNRYGHCNQVLVPLQREGNF